MSKEHSSMSDSQVLVCALAILLAFVAGMILGGKIEVANYKAHVVQLNTK